jgi:inner membrane protein
VIGRTHIAIGLMTSACLISTPNLESAIISAGVTAFSSVLPDIDHSNGLIRRISGVVSKPFNIILGFLVLFWLTYRYQLPEVSVIVLTFAIMLSLFMPHRSFTHSFIGLFVFSLGIYLAYKPIFLPFTIGYFMHLFADFFTTSGMQLYFPLKHYERFGIVTTGSLEDDLIGMVSMIIFLTIAHFKLS